MAKDKQTAPKKKGAKPKAAKAETQKVAMVAIGASAGGLEPFERFFDAMPVNSDIAFVIIQHLSPDFESMMDELLSRHSSMDIERVVNDLKVRPNTIYLNPPRSKMIIKNGKFVLKDKPESRELNLPIDIFFDSFAQEYGKEAIAIVLSGTGSDGTRGAAVVKGHEGAEILMLWQRPPSFPHSSSWYVKASQSIRHILAWLRTILKSIFSSGYVTNTALILAITKKPL